jgi:predicted solute-binding protein
MPFSLETASRETKRLPVPFGTQILTLEYRFGAVTTDRLKQIALDSRQLAADMEIAETVARVKREAYQVTLSDPDATAEQTTLAENEYLAANDRVTTLAEKSLTMAASDIADMILSWDMEFIPGQPVPIEPEAIAKQVPLPLQEAILQAIQNANKPDPLKSKRSTST